MPHAENLTDERQMERFNKSFQWSRRTLEPFRKQRLENVKEMLGTHYGDGASDRDVILNLIELTVSIYRRQIAPGNPRALATTGIRRLRPSAKRLELAINRTYSEIDFASTLEDWVTDALLGLGIVKAGITPRSLGEQEGFRHDAGMIFVDIVDLDDWCHDMTSRRYEQVQYAANRYRLPVDVVLEDPMFHVERADIPLHSEMRHNNEQGDRRAASLGNQGTPESSLIEMEETVELWDVWVPRHQVIWTLLANPTGGMTKRKPIREVDWSDQPEVGPYHLLSYGAVPNNSMPLSPISVLKDLHDLANNIMRKLKRQAMRQKTITGVRGVAQKDGQNVIESNDGDMRIMEDPNAIREFRFGGVDGPLLAFGLQIRELFYDAAGNLDALGGLSPQSGTLGQDEILNSNASRRMETMREKTIKAVQGVTRTIANYLWHDPTVEIPVEVPIDGTNLTFPSTFKQDLKEGDLIEYEIDIHPYSMSPQTPASRMQTVAGIFDRFVGPYAQMMQEQGLTINFQELFDMLAEYANVPELRNILEVSSFREEAAGGGGSSPSRPLQAPTTRRVNERVNRSETTRSGTANALTAGLLGAGGPANAPRIGENGAA